MAQELVSIRDSDGNTAKVSARAFETIYKAKGFVLVDGDAASPISSSVQVGPEANDVTADALSGSGDVSGSDSDDETDDPSGRRSRRS